MKNLFLSLLFLSGCSTVNVYPVSHFVNLSANDLALESQANLKEAGVNDYQPSKKERNAYFTQLESSIAYRNYLYLECVMILHKEHGLILEKPIYVSIPKWNNVQNWYSTIVSYHFLKNKVPTETKAECDLAINDKKEVSDYQIIEYYPDVLKN